MRRVAALLALTALGLALPAAAPAASAPLPQHTDLGFPTNQLEQLLGLFYGQAPKPAPVQRHEPRLAAVPRARCGKGSHPLTGEQGRVPASAVNSPQAARGWTCNVRVVSHHDTPGGFRVWRYADAHGHVCGYYDTSIAGPIDAVSLAAAPTQGVVVLDMKDPARPRETDRLLAPGMLSPHESLNLNPRRGLLAAEVGTAATAPALMSLYSVRSDCRHPVLESNYLAAPFGHESGFSPDGRTFWIGGAQGIYAVDVTDPRNPRTVATIDEPSHGVNLSPNGKTLYDTNVLDGELTLLDVSRIQDRPKGGGGSLLSAGPPVHEISRLTWGTASIPQNTNPITINGKPYLLEYDEFAFRFNPPRMDDKAGAARIIGLSDPKHPRVVSNLRLQVNMPANHRKADNDPSFASGSAFEYAGHYCNVPRRVNPGIAACSFLNSGLRIFDIRNPRKPREVAYFVSPPTDQQGQKADAAFAQPAFDPKRREVWFSDAGSGFWNVKLSTAAWPRPTARR